MSESQRTATTLGAKKKKRRSDAGTVKLTPRDLYLLLWISQMHAVCFDHLRILAGRYSPQSNQKVKNQISEPVCYRLLNRWQKLDLVERKHILYGQPPWIWLTANGLALIDSAYPYRRPAVGKLRHTYALNGVRLFVEEKLLKGKYDPQQAVFWASDRLVQRERQERGRRHIVDGEVMVEGETVAIEVELSIKSRQRLVSILSELAEDYVVVWYFAPVAVHTALKRAITEAGVSADQFKLYNLPPLAAYELHPPPHGFTEI